MPLITIPAMPRPKPKKAQPKVSLEELGRYKAAALMIGGFVHQLRTPIHIIQSSAEDLYKQNRFMPNFKPQAELIARSAERLATSVNALLSFVKGDKRPLQEGSLHDLLHQLGDFLQEECRRRSVKLEQKLAHTHSLRLDPYLLQEALLNLLTNALQAMPKGGTLSIRSQNQNPDKIVLEIADTGQGMDAKTLKRIETPFHTTKKGGLGLGLYFTRTILKQHGGTLQFSSQKGKGTTVRLVFPAV